MNTELLIKWVSLRRYFTLGAYYCHEKIVQLTYWQKGIVDFATLAHWIVQHKEPHRIYRSVPRTNYSFLKK